MADTDIGRASSVVPPPKQPTEEEEQGYRPIDEDDIIESKWTLIIFLFK